MDGGTNNSDREHRWKHTVVWLVRYVVHTYHTFIDVPNEDPCSSSATPTLPLWALLDQDNLSVLVCPGGSDQRMWTRTYRTSTDDCERERDRVCEFGSYCGVVNGIGIYLKGRLTTGREEGTTATVPLFSGCFFPAELKNLHTGFVRRTQPCIGIHCWRRLDSFTRCL
mmetsp:Transcript_2788/g.3233  ORF Transcript_2788/g.3233 Transcript_2788/m.3233 type:complete len:168 (+) Transcript_2788:145-648(+)